MKQERGERFDKDRTKSTIARIMDPATIETSIFPVDAPSFAGFCSAGSSFLPKFLILGKEVLNRLVGLIPTEKTATFPLRYKTSTVDKTSRWLSKVVLSLDPGPLSSFLSLFIAYLPVWNPLYLERLGNEDVTDVKERISLIKRALWDLADSLNKTSSEVRNARRPDQLEQYHTDLFKQLTTLDHIRDAWADHQRATRLNGRPDIRKAP